MEIQSPQGSSGDNTELGRVLRQYDLIQYEDRLKENAFDTWEAVMGITETDMKEMSLPLGHRRKLQRAIHEYSLPSTSEETFDPWPKRMKRTYRRRPVPDHNAPAKPKTAYVLFGEHVREKEDGSGSTFAEIAKQTGKAWRELPQEERTNLWENPAIEKRREYDLELKNYKMDEKYHIYQAYLKDFKAKAKQPKRESATAPDDHVFRSAYFDHVSSGSVEQSGVHSAVQSELNTGDAFSSARIAVDMDIDHPSQQLALPTDQGMQEVNVVFDSLGVNNELTRVDAYPPENITTIAVEAFLFGTGSLIYLWSATEALHLVEAVYHTDSQTAPVDAIEIFAMAAVGSYCDGVAMIEPYQKKFMHYFIHMMSSYSDVSEFRRMRLLVCLATCRFVDNIESARTLMLSALQIGRAQFSSPATLELEYSLEQRQYWWNIFRSVLFLETWFAFNTGRETRIVEEDLNLYHPPLNTGLQQVKIHELIGELGMIAAYIAFDLKETSRPLVDQVQLRLQSLDKWHRTLPPPMRLNQLSIADPLGVKGYTKRSVLQLHILFLGLFTEPYRTCLVEIGKSRLDDSFGKQPQLKGLEMIEEQCVSAARQSARIASLLQVDELIRSHCWVTVYTSFTGCTILLFSATQKLLMLREKDIDTDLLYVSSHMNLLSVCSSNSRTARKLFTVLQIIYNDVRDLVLSPVYRAMRDLQYLEFGTAPVPQSYFEAFPGSQEVLESVRDVTERAISLLQDKLHI